MNLVITPLVTMPEISNSFKNLKPPTFRGEEKDWNKDSVHTFIQKWTDLHVLRRTSDEQRALETSFSLEGKAYKWWLSLAETACTRTWNAFQELFRKEFLLENEKDRNWNAWDRCWMENLTLTQYISKYQEISLKLEGLDDF